MLTTDQITDTYNRLGIDDVAKLEAFLRPAAISAQLADYDGQLAALAAKRNEFLSAQQVEQERIVAEREAVRAKLQGEK